MRLTFAIFLVCLCALARGATVTLVWDVADLAAGSRVYYGPASRTYTNSVDAGNTNALTLTGLRVGSRYFFAATDYTSDGLESDFSNEATWLRLAPPSLLKPNIQIVAAQFVLEESADLRTWAVVDQTPVIFTRPFDPTAPARYYRTVQINAGAPITIALTL